ncbi:MAG: hypothetical protein U0324_03885 [Polyangiales bacterium]
MTDPADPPRWSGDARAPSSVRDALRGARGYRPSPAQAEAVAQAVTKAVTAPAAAPASAALTAKAKLLLGALAVAAAAGWATTRRNNGAHTPHTRPAIAARTAPVEPARPTPVEAADAAVEPPVDAAGAAITDDAGSDARRPPGCVEREHDARVAAAQAALRDGDAARALALSNQDKARCPRGHSAEDRERVAIESLARLGRRGEAAARWERFQSAFPDSLYARRLRAVLGEAP